MLQNLKLEQSRKFEDGSVAGALEVKFTCPFSGAAVKETWDLKNSIAAEFALADKPLKGHKLTYSNTFSTTGGSVLLYHTPTCCSTHLRFIFATCFRG
jgi:hypothetical protein